MKIMLRSTALAVGLGVAASAGASAETTLTIVSWGGAYTESQKKAYHEPYMANNPEVKILNDDSAAEGLAKLRAQVESGNITWDIVDMIASDSITACDVLMASNTLCSKARSLRRSVISVANLTTLVTRPFESKIGL